MILFVYIKISISTPLQHLLLTVYTPMQAIFTQAIGLVLAENQRVLQAITYPAVEQLAQKITDVERIFVKCS